MYDENTREFWEEKRVKTTDKLALEVTETILPQLRALFTQLLGLQQFWVVNEIEDKVQAAIDANETLSGYLPSDWYLWGATVRELLEWVNAPTTVLMDKTPLQVFLKDYEKQ